METIERRDVRPAIPPSGRPFSLPRAKGGWLGKLSSIVANSLERLLSIDKVNDTYDAATGSDSHVEFFHKVLEHLNISYHLAPEDLARIPRTGPVVVVANHPFGAIEGVVLAHLLTSVRPDTRIMANYILGRMPESRNLFIFVDPFAGEQAVANNLQGMRQSMHCLKNGGMLGVFPAGEVAHLDLRGRRIIDPAWSPMIARLVRRTGASVLPIFFEGANSMLFHLMGLVHPRLRTAMLARELFKRRHSRIHMRIGSLIPAAKIKDFPTDERLITYLRCRTYMLAHRKSAPPKSRPARDRREPIVAASPASAIIAEVASLPPEQALAVAGSFTAFTAQAPQIPAILHEIGRLREIAFRETGEGSGKSIDLDRFDQTYTHLFIWNRTKREIVGAYRLGPTDRILPAHGLPGLYTSTLFHYDLELMRRLGPAIEMGRSFIRAEYQKTYAPLLLLWKGIGHFAVRNPQYRYLFGPVSISNAYQSVSRQLMVEFLKRNHYPPQLAPLVRPRRPWSGDVKNADVPMWDELLRADDVNELIADLEPQQKGLPVLLRQYLKLGAKLLAFNIDPDFNDALDGLMLVDLTQTDPRLLDHYMGEEGRKQFLAHHGVQ